MVEASKRFHVFAHGDHGIIQRDKQRTGKAARMNLGSESETVEFKKSTGEHKEALQAISAMLNKHGRGELYFGCQRRNAAPGDVVGVRQDRARGVPDGRVPRRR